MPNEKTYEETIPSFREPSSSRNIVRRTTPDGKVAYYHAGCNRELETDTEELNMTVGCVMGPIIDLLNTLSYKDEFMTPARLVEYLVRNAWQNLDEMTTALEHELGEIKIIRAINPKTLAFHDEPILGVEFTPSAKSNALATF